MQESEFISVAEAREILGVSKTRIAEMVKRGELGETEQNPVDRRGKLVRRSVVEALAAKAGKKEAA
jgi:helix-turn-helix protein